jgi:diaminohydroxyphosphoribosylaminopyrimidine deaminase/5-amino-6-(5-phosphoribosylamino)uracil reductase
MVLPEDVRFMQQALSLGARGYTAPNPHVGAVVVRDGAVVGEGWHERAGGPHAEVGALQAAGELARGATLYCSLEPCCHHGRTPPCTDAIIQRGIRRVVIGCADPKVHGPLRGVDVLRAAGIEVEIGIEDDAARDLVMDFACVAHRRRPFVTLKAAVTLDGRTASRTGDSKWITNEASRAEVHRMRSVAGAVMVGVGTVLRDDPQLTARGSDARRQPLRVVLDTHLRTPVTAQLVQGAREVSTLIMHGPEASPESRKALVEQGVELLEVGLVGTHVDLDRALAKLTERDILSVFVEGGGTLHGSLLDQGLADVAAIFVAPVILGDTQAPGLASRAAAPVSMADALKLSRVRTRTFGGDVLFEGDFQRLVW